MYIWALLFYPLCIIYECVGSLARGGRDKVVVDPDDDNVRR